MRAKKQGKQSTLGGTELSTNPFAELKAEGLLAKAIAQPQSGNPISTAGRVELRREKSGRGGKTVTTLSAFATHHTQRDLEVLLRELKQACACGGSRKERVLELQGDLRETVYGALTARGFKPVMAGG